MKAPLTLRAHPAPHPRRAAGFTLIETLAALAITGILSGLAYPSFEAQMQKTRRSDALVTMMQVQMAQERFRANNSSYGSLAQIGAASTSPAAHYALQVLSNDANGYEVLATATGAQARDRECRQMKLSLVGASVTYASGADAALANPDSLNRRCWNL